MGVNENDNLCDKLNGFELDMSALQQKIHELKHNEKRKCDEIEKLKYCTEELRIEMNSKDYDFQTKNKKLDELNLLISRLNTDLDTERNLTKRNDLLCEDWEIREINLMSELKKLQEDLDHQ